jgi:seipin
VEVARGGAETGVRALGAGEGQVQVYSASLTFSARFEGMRYLVYNHRVVSFVVFSMVFYVVSIVSMGLVWAWVGPSIMGKGEQALVKREQGGRVAEAKKKDAVVKTEDEEGDDTTGFRLEDLSDTPAHYPSGRGRPPLKYEAKPPESGPSAQPQEREVGEGEKADDEDDEGDAEMERAYARATGRFEGDSGIGTMSEGARTGPDLVRRRSGRSLGGRQ